MHVAAFELRHTLEKRLEGFVERHRFQAVQFGGACRAIEHAAGDMPVPGAHLGGIQSQVQAFLAVLEGLFGAFALTGVDKSAEQVDRAFEFDVLGAEDAVMDLAIAGAKLHFQGDRTAVATRGFKHQVALLRIGPQTKLDGGFVDHLVAGPAERLFEVLIDLMDQAIGAAGQQHHIGAQMKQRGKALFRIDQRGFALPLAGDFAYHSDHLGAAVLVLGQAAIDFQPVQAAVGPADTVAQGLFHRLAVEDRIKGLQGARAVFGWQQVEVIQVVG
ncbi:hypothetical protein D3C78_695690 [compost metagenome]